MTVLPQAVPLPLRPRMAGERTSGGPTTQRWSVRVAVLFLTAIPFAAFGYQQPVRAADPDSKSSAETSPGWRPFFIQQARRYEIHCDRDGTALAANRRADRSAANSLPVATLLAQPILKWAQPVRGGEEGVVVLWTVEDRPVVIATLFVWPSTAGQNEAHELHSLCTGSIRAEFQDQAWETSLPGVEWLPIKDSHQNATTPRAREREVRQVLRRFTAQATDDEMHEWQLRALTAPLYEYDAGLGPKSGAVCGLVEGTDLEVVVLIELRRPEPTAEPTWHYALARMSDRALAVELDGAPVWQKPRTMGQPESGPYQIISRGIHQRPPVVDE